MPHDNYLKLMYRLCCVLFRPFTVTIHAVSNQHKLHDILNSTCQWYVLFLIFSCTYTFQLWHFNLSSSHLVWCRYYNCTPNSFRNMFRCEILNLTLSSSVIMRLSSLTGSEHFDAMQEFFRWKNTFSGLTEKRRPTEPRGVYARICFLVMTTSYGSGGTGSWIPARILFPQP